MFAFAGSKQEDLVALKELVESGKEAVPTVVKGS